MDFSRLNGRRAISLAAALLLVTAATPLVASAQADDSASALTDDISEPATPDWGRIDDAATDSSGQVLELPQVVDPDESSADTTPPADGTSADETTDDSAAALASGEDNAAIPAGDEADYLDDYADRLTAGRALALSPPITSYYPAAGSWRYITIPPASVIIVRPAGLGGIPATSPLLTTPRGSGPVFGGWWHRVR